MCQLGAWGAGWSVGEWETGFLVQKLKGLSRTLPRTNTAFISFFSSIGSVFASCCCHPLFLFLDFFLPQLTYKIVLAFFFSFTVNRTSLLSFWRFSKSWNNKWGFVEEIKRLVGKQGKIWVVDFFEPRNQKSFSVYLEGHSDFLWSFPRKSMKRIVIRSIGGKCRYVRPLAEGTEHRRQ